MQELGFLSLILIYSSAASIRHCMGRTYVCVCEDLEALLRCGYVAIHRISTYLHSSCCVNNSSATLHYWDTVKIKVAFHCTPHPSLVEPDYIIASFHKQSYY